MSGILWKRKLAALYGQRTLTKRQRKETKFIEKTAESLEKKHNEDTSTTNYDFSYSQKFNEL